MLGAILRHSLAPLLQLQEAGSQSTELQSRPRHRPSRSRSSTDLEALLKGEGVTEVQEETLKTAEETAAAAHRVRHIGTGPHYASPQKGEEKGNFWLLVL